MSGKPAYAELVAQAERAVQDVKDAELRKVAFEKILDALLSEASETAAPPATVAAGVKLEAKKQKAAKPDKDTRKTATNKKARKGPKAYVRELVDDDFFKKPKTLAQVKVELENRGHHIAVTSLSGPLQALCKERTLRRQKTKAKAGGKKQTYDYSEW
ncbi:hypothetical protein ACFLSF_03075 [Candidatus Bipolaricaulota bacterium]